MPGIYAIHNTPTNEILGANERNQIFTQPPENVQIMLLGAAFRAQL
jgi:hypothetical protein